MRREEEIAEMKVILTKIKCPFKIIEKTIEKLINRKNKQNMVENVDKNWKNDILSCLM